MMQAEEEINTWQEEEDGLVLELREVKPSKTCSCCKFATILLGSCLGVFAGILLLNLSELSFPIVEVDDYAIDEKTFSRRMPACSLEITNASSWAEFVQVTSAKHILDCIASPNERKCQCGSPLEPLPNYALKSKGWDKAKARNLDLLASVNKTLDVVLLGDSMTEHWLGTDLAWPRPAFAENNQVYQELFGTTSKNDDHTGLLNTLALGIGGDRTPNILYRLLHGELSKQPRLYWLLAGINDALGDHCTPDLILAGIIQITQLLLAATNATIVLNSILPFGDRDLSNDTHWMWQQERQNVYTQCYAESFHRRVEFFNATSLFVVAGTTKVDMSKLSKFDKFHPNGKGSRAWGTAMLERIHQLLQ